MAAELSPSHVATDRNDEHEGNAQGQQLTHAVQSGLENLEYHGSVVFSIIDGIKEEIITLLDELKAASVSDLDR